MVGAVRPGGDVDISSVALLFADPTRARVLVALSDGRALPASVLASEAGVTPQAVSTQLGRLREAGLLEVEQSGRHRYYRISGAAVTEVIEAMAQLAPMQPVKSLRQSTKAAALRNARTCYDHLAGRLGVELTQSLVDNQVLLPRDGIPDTRRRPGDRLATQMRHHPYQLGPRAPEVLTGLGLSREQLNPRITTGRPLLRFCVDWSEQRHHLAGRLGAHLLQAFVEAGWIVRIPGQRWVQVTPQGRQALHQRLGLDPAGSLAAAGPSAGQAGEIR